MFFSPRIGLKQLVELCGRLSTAVGAAIDLRTVWAREADRTTGPLRTRVLLISQAIHRGETLGDALARTEDYFPSLFRELIVVGEQTGCLERVLAQLAEYYRGRLTIRRHFLAAISWPLVELAVTLAVIGFAIWIMGVLPVKADIFGFGLVGTGGLIAYLSFLGVLGLLFWLACEAIRRGLAWTAPVQRLMLKVPVIGNSLQTVALSRLAWSMHLTMNTGMDVRKAMKLSLGSTRNARYLDQISVVDAEIVAGNSIHEAFCRAGGYPADFLDTLAVGEESGQVAESMERLAQQYQEQARSSVAILMNVAVWLVWAVIAAVIAVFIFRGFSFYLRAINNAMQR
ncbi:MAG: type II secretion system F family protein [Thermoguttaceae bacterium]